MNNDEKIIAAMKRLADENADLRKQIHQHRMLFLADMKIVIDGFAERFNEVDETHRRSVDGINEVLAGHEVALIQLGTDPQPVRLIADGEVSPDLERSREDNAGTTTTSGESDAVGAIEPDYDEDTPFNHNELHQCEPYAHAVR